MNIEHRPDCEEFQPKRWAHDCKDCQTDGHYLCSGCRNIASFEDMELYDNLMRYYPNQQKERDKEEREREEMLALLDDNDS